jgi:hypothetical protein
MTLGSLHSKLASHHECPASKACAHLMNSSASSTAVSSGSVIQCQRWTSIIKLSDWAPHQTTALDMRKIRVIFFNAPTKDTQRYPSLLTSSTVHKYSRALNFMSLRQAPLRVQACRTLKKSINVPLSQSSVSKSPPLSHSPVSKSEMKMRVGMMFRCVVWKWCLTARKIGKK